jgi:NAD(P)-dependent dehydrogenase (short-subunit alcohol dehydrogenase family)
MPRVLVSGATGGSGPATVRAFERDGWEVVQASRSLGHDLRDPEVAARVVAEAGPLDAAAHLVGGYADGQPVGETPLDVFRGHWEQHVASAYNVAHAAIGALREGGALVLFSSRAAQRPFAGAAGYASAKAAIVALARTIDLEGTRCNVISPAAIDDPEALADTVVWLCSPASRAVHGAVLDI